MRFSEFLLGKPRIRKFGIRGRCLRRGPGILALHEADKDRSELTFLRVPFIARAQVQIVSPHFLAETAVAWHFWV